MPAQAPLRGLNFKPTHHPTMRTIIRGNAMKRHASIRPSHPGEVNRNTDYGLLNQKQAVTAEMAVRLEVAFGSTAETVAQHTSRI